MNRRRWFCHRSPTDSLLIHFGRWLDGAIVSMPNRYAGSLPLGSSAGRLSAVAVQPAPFARSLCCQTSAGGSTAGHDCVLYALLSTTDCAAVLRPQHSHTGSWESPAELMLCISKLQ